LVSQADQTFWIKLIKLLVNELLQIDMKVVLIKDVQNLGNAGEVKEVADGYARNFLIPGGYVELATEAAVKRAEKLRVEKEKRAEEELKKAEELASKLEGVSVTMTNQEGFMRL
jgi:large subunit ribosomal protein L9